jgi:hypothetical protein
MSMLVAAEPRSALVIPRIVRVALADDRWIELRERLNHGEYTAFYRSLYVERAGDLQRDPLNWGDKVVVAYLLDWNITDDAGRILPLRGLGPDDVQSMLNTLDQDVFLEVKEAVETHANAIERARAEKKRRRTSDDGSSPT